jgi:hypothetical protein
LKNEHDRYLILIFMTSDLTELPKNAVTPSQADRNNLYCHPFESIIIDLKPSQGASLRLDGDIPQVNNAMMTI